MAEKHYDEMGIGELEDLRRAAAGNESWTTVVEITSVLTIRDAVEEQRVNTTY